ncbi:MAG: hypothetical protein JWM91_2090 [Rhodospirillales bacterium]|nr:hypothetical protein [Rhodospirillales bacterium]
MAQKFPDPEFSRPFVVDRLGSTAITETLDANAAERAALALRMDLVSLDQLSARVTLERAVSGLIHVTGRFEADIIQTCVVTLAAFPSHVEDSFALDFGDAPGDSGDEINVDIDCDPPEPLEDGVIDIGELVAQYLALALDPHPRAPGATLETVWSNSNAGERSPFAILKNLKTSN